jgi:oxidase EvaA
MNNKSVKYINDYENYKTFFRSLSFSNNYEHSLEASFEALNDWSLFYTLAELKEWFETKRNSSTMQLEEVGINKLKDWSIDPKTGNISHFSNDFFIVRGLKVSIKSREVNNGWDQPIVEQVGYDGGILGIIRKRFDGVPHYLCEAKTEPGNYGHVQLSPTIQATFANLNQSHRGRKPYFTEYFDKDNFVKGSKVLFDAWMAEDGGRLYNKRNRGILIELPESHKIKLPTDNFVWASLYQIKHLMREDAWINPHIRGILAHV